MRNVRFFVVLIILALAELGAARPGRAEETASPEGSRPLEEQFHDLDQKVRILERKLELERESGAEKAKEAPTLKVGKEGFFLKSADDNFSLRLGGHIQADGRFFLYDKQKVETNTFQLTRVRPILEGTLYQYYDFRIMTDFGAGTTAGSTMLQDAYLDIGYWPQAKLQVGKFKAPISLERLQSDAYMLFIERGLPTDLAPNRDAGAQLHADLWDGAFSYAIGVLNGVPDGGSGETDPNDNKSVDGRIFVQPFKRTGIEPLRDLGFGVAASHGNDHGTAAAPNLPSYKTALQQTFFSYRGAVAAVPASGTTPASPAVPPVVSDGELLRFSPQAYYYWGSFGLLAEYIVSSQEVALNATTGARSAKLKNTAEQVAVSYVITGGAASYTGVTPKKSFDPRNGRWGELELKARVNKLTVDKDAFPLYANPVSASQRATEWGAGVNWYLNKNMKIVVEYEHTVFKWGGGGTAAKPLDREDEKAIVERFQIIF